MFVRDLDDRSNTEIALDDFITIGLECDHSVVREELEKAIDVLQEKLYWYKILLIGMDRRKKVDWVAKYEEELKKEEIRRRE